MNRTRIKICGITREVDALLAASLGADATGFILAPSQRRIELSAAIEIVRGLPPFLDRVAVLVNPSPRELEGVVQSRAFTHIQLHGTEAPETCNSQLLPVVKAFPLLEECHLDQMRQFLHCCSVTVLADARSGGSGETCDWSLAARAAREWPLVLAGGLDPNNVAEAIESVRPAAVDVSSGVEASAGVKDPARMEAFFAAVRSADTGRGAQKSENRSIAP